MHLTFCFKLGARLLTDESLEIESLQFKGFRLEEKLGQRLAGDVQPIKRDTVSSKALKGRLRLGGRKG